jgi:hypothetical protein
MRGIILVVDAAFWSSCAAFPKCPATTKAERKEDALERSLTVFKLTLRNRQRAKEMRDQ